MGKKDCRKYGVPISGPRKVNVLDHSDNRKTVISGNKDEKKSNKNNSKPDTPNPIYYFGAVLSPLG